MSVLTFVEYTFQVYQSDGTTPAVTAPDGSNNGTTVEITLNSTYAAGCVIQHMGYIISGTTADGTYLEVRDLDTAASDDVDYFLRSHYYRLSFAYLIVDF